MLVLRPTWAGVCIQFWRMTAGTDENRQQELLKLEKRWLKAEDDATLESILADDFIYALSAGFVPSEQNRSSVSAEAIPTNSAANS
jgi:hypothetical protein